MQNENDDDDDDDEDDEDEDACAESWLGLIWALTLFNSSCIAAWPNIHQMYV